MYNRFRHAGERGAFGLDSLRLGMGGLSMSGLGIVGLRYEWDKQGWGSHVWDMCGRTRRGWSRHGCGKYTYHFSYAIFIKR